MSEQNETTVTVPWWELMGRELYHVDGWHDCPSPRCGHCGEPLFLELYPVVRWNCSACLKWAWIEPPNDQQITAPAGAEGQR